MTRERIRALFIEDSGRDLDRYARLLSEEDKITIIPTYAPRHINELSLDPPLELVLIDYRLTERQPSGIFATYRGGTLANYIVEQLPEIPLILISTRDVLGLFPNYENEIRSVDYVFFKEDINQDPSFWKNFLITLVQGFKTLASVAPSSRTWGTLMQLLKANSSEEEDLERSSPPRRKNGGSWTVHDVAGWILRVLFRYPGPFYDSLYASTALGIREEDFLLQEVQSFFHDAIYCGVFGEIKKLWWRDRLREQAFRCIREQSMEPILPENFMLAFEKKTGMKLRPSVCVYSGELNANTVCYILKKPVKMKYTLGYLPDDRPESMEPARVSFKAIIEEDINEEFLPREDAEMLEEVRRGRIC